MGENGDGNPIRSSPTQKIKTLAPVSFSPKAAHRNKWPPFCYNRSKTEQKKPKFVTKHGRGAIEGKTMIRPL